VARDAKFGLTDFRLGSEQNVAIPFNAAAVAEVHIHPAGSKGFSGGSIFSNGVRRDYQGDVWGYVNRPVNGYVFNAGSREGWHFNSRGYLDALQTSAPGAYVSFRSFVKKIR
jgi:hypothetical protein